jgi:hypothetical protein
MRTFGRSYAEDGTYTWVAVETDANGFNDAVYLTTLIQCLKLNLGESPFYSQYGIPAKQSVIQQIWPDYNAALTQQQFAPFFASLIIAKEAQATVPTYTVNVTTNQGAKLIATVEV